MISGGGMNWSILSKVSLGFAAALAIVITIDAVSYRSLTAFINHVDAIARIYRIDDALVHVLRQLQDAETGQRGFLITGQESYLRPYEEAMHTLEQDIDRMRAMVRGTGSPYLARRVEELDPLVSEKLAELRKTIEIRRAEGFNAAQVLVRSDLGMKAMNEIRRLIGEMRQETHNLIRSGESEMQTRARDTITIISVGSVLGFLLLAGATLVIQRDLAGRQRIQEERLRLEQSRRRNETMEAMGVLVAGVAHQVRNPLFAISSTVDAMEKRLGSRDEYQKYVRVLKSESARLAKLMQQLLNYAKPPTGDLKPVQFQEALHEAVQSFDTRSTVSGLRVRMEAPDDLPPLLCDRDRLVQLFHNLVENAMQFSPAGGDVCVAARQDNRNGQPWIECTVDDNGPGVRNEDLPHVFEPFFSRREGGTGLGLAVAQQIVCSTGGEIHIENRPNGGARVKVRLPVNSPARNERKV
jgi:signal transduction histidine kinase